MRRRGYGRVWERCISKIKKGSTEQQRKTTTKKHSSSYYDDLDSVLGHRPALRPPFVLYASAGGLSVEPNQEGERLDRSSEGESGKAIHFTCTLYMSRLPSENDSEINVTKFTDDQGLLYKNKGKGHVLQMMTQKVCKTETGYSIIMCKLHIYCLL